MDIILNYKTSHRTVHYELRRTEESELLGGKSSNAVHLYFSLSYLGKREGLDSFDYRVSSVTQTCHTGLYAWVEDMYSLMRYLQLGISGEGRLERVFNRSDIYREWDRKVCYATRKKHLEEDNTDAMLKNIDTLLDDEVAFAGSLRYAPPFSLLFSGLHGMTFEREKEEKRTGRLSGFAGAPFLPLILEDEITTATNPDESYEVKTEGKPDEKMFDRKQFGNFVRMLGNDPTMVNDLQVRHTERYSFDAHHWVKNGMWLHLSVVPYFLMREERCFLKAIES